MPTNPAASKLQPMPTTVSLNQLRTLLKTYYTSQINDEAPHNGIARRQGLIISNSKLLARVSFLTM
jgi:hypothetical protein